MTVPINNFAVDGSGVALGVGTGGGADTFLSRAAAANWKLGTADAAAPVAQTLSVQNVVTGTSNTAGTDFAINLSQSTGTGVSGKFTVFGCAVGSTGSTQNASSRAFTITPGFGGNNGRTAVWVNGTSVLYLLFGTDNGSVNNWGLSVNGGLSVNDNTGNAPHSWGVNRSVMGPNTQLGWATTGGNQTPDTIWGRTSAAVITQGGAASATPIAQIYNAQSSRAGTDSNVGGANLTVQSGLGTGTSTPSNLVLSGVVGTTTGTGAQSYSAGLTVAGVATGQLPSVVLGSAAIATNATDGFLYAVSGAGQPTGTPTTFTGRVPIYIDTTNSQLWMYLSGSWKQPKTPAGAALITWQ